MRLVIILPQEQALLATRRYTDAEQGTAIMHAIDSDVFQYLCSHTDWATGQIGVRSALSYAHIAMALTEDIPRKHALRVVTRKCVNNSVQRLINVGLLVSESLVEKTQKRLQLRRVFWQALLRADISSNHPDSRQMVGLLQELAKHNVLFNSHLQKNTAIEDDPSYPADGRYKGITIPKAESASFRLSLTWQYDRNLVELFLQAAGFSSQQIKQVWFGKYVQYWSQQPICRTQAEWSAHFANHMQSYLLRPNFFEEVNGMLGDRSKAKAKKNTHYQRTPTTKRQPKKLTVPRLNDGSQLQQWAVANGLPVSPVGLDTTGYYRFLCRQVEQYSFSHK